MSQIIILFIRILNIYQMILFFYVLSSWFPGVRSSKLGTFIGSLVEPYLLIFRKVIPPLGMIDFSPFIAFWVLNLATVGLTRFL